MTAAPAAAAMVRRASSRMSGPPPSPPPDVGAAVGLVRGNGAGGDVGAGLASCVTLKVKLPVPLSPVATESTVQRNVHSPLTPPAGRPEIGRASCRERGEISV